MKFLYIAAEHVSGTLALFREEHRRRGDECRFVTFWHSRWDFPDDICLNLPFMPDRSWVRGLRDSLRALRPSELQPSHEMPYWRPGNVERSLFALRDSFIWPRIERAIHKFDLNSFDVIQLDGGLDFTRDARFARQAIRRGKHVACFYHGSDLRTRGIIPAVDEIAELRLTSEWDLLDFDSRLRYLYLPFDTSAYPEREYRFHHPVRICHASRNPHKGTSFVEAAVAELKKRYEVELIMLRDLSHDEALRRKYECDIFVDQLTNAGGWGYGMSSVEALAMGMPVVTNIPENMMKRLGENPFVHAATDDLSEVLEELLNSETMCGNLAKVGRQWVCERHDVRAVGDQLYSFYQELGWIAPNRP